MECLAGRDSGEIPVRRELGTDALLECISLRMDRIDSHRRDVLASVRQERGDLRGYVSGDVLDVVRHVGLEEQQVLRPVRVTAVGEELVVTGGDEPVCDEPAGMAVVRMQPVPPPRIVTEHARRAARAGSPRRPPCVLHVAFELAVVLPRKVTSPPPRAFAAALAALDSDFVKSADSVESSQVPLEPSVRTRWCIRQPAAAHLARVPPQPNSMSSGCAPTASATAGIREIDRRCTRAVGKVADGSLIPVASLAE